MNNRLAHNTLHSAIASLSVVLGGFISNVIVARLLGVEAAGIVAFATWAITLGVMFGDLGSPGTLARYIPDLRARGQSSDADGIARWLSRVNLIGASIVCAAFVGYALWLSQDGKPTAGVTTQRQPLFWLLVAGACFVQGIGALCSGYLRGLQNFALMARLALMSSVLQIVATICGALIFGPLGALAGAIAAGLAPALVIPRVLRTSGTLPDALKSRVRRFSLESWAGYLVTAFAWSRMEIFFLQISWGSHSVALFAASATLANLATQGPLLLTGGLLPHLSQQSGRTDRKSHDTYAMSIRLMSFLIFPACFGAAAIAPALVPAIYGQDFAAAVPSTIVLLAGSALTASCSVAFTYLLAMERTRFIFAAGGVAALAVIASGLIIVPIYGVMAASIARVGIQTSVSVATLWYLARHLDCPTPIMSLMRIAVAAMLCAVAAHLCIGVVQGSLGIAIAVAVGACVYALAVRLLRALTKSDSDKLSNALAILPRPIWIPAARTLRLIAP